MNRTLTYSMAVLTAAAIAVTASRSASSAGQGTALVRLQSATPGTPQTGNANLTGTLIAGQHQGGGAGLTGLNATNISSGTVADARLSSNVALLNSGQVFSGAKTFSAAPSFTAAGVPFLVTGSTVVSNLNADLLDGQSGAYYQSAANLIGTLPDARLSTNVSLLNAAQAYSAVKTFSVAPSFTAASAPFTVAGTTLVTNLNADQLDGQHGAFYQSAANLTGTILDARLSTNVALLGTTQTFSALKVFGSSFQIPSGGGAGKFLTSDAVGVGSWSVLPPPSGAAGGDLFGTYPNPTVASGAITGAKILDGTIATADIGASQINDAKISDVAWSKVTGAPWTGSGATIFNANTGNVGIGTSTPGAKLEVAGTAKMTGFQLGTASTTGWVLTTNASGVGTWQAAPGGLSLPFTGSTNVVGNAFAITNSDGPAISGTSSLGGAAILGTSNGSGDGIYGICYGTTGHGVVGEATGGGIGVYGLASNSSTYAGYFSGAVTIVGNTTLNGAISIPNNAGFGKILMSDASGTAAWQSPNLLAPLSLSSSTTAATLSAQNSNANGTGVYGSGKNGVEGYSTSPSDSGVWGHNGGSGHGVAGSTTSTLAQGTAGMWGLNSSTGIGIKGTSWSGIAGYFEGNGYFSGNVGIGTTTPDTKLRVVGTAKVDILEIAGGGDVAERFVVRGQPKPGQVVEIDPNHPGDLRVCTQAGSKLVAGVVSGANGLSAGMVLSPKSSASERHAIALTGKVWVQCDAGQEGIEPGEMLVSSKERGLAAAASGSQSSGAVIGKAMTRLAKGQRGLVLVLVSLR